MSRQQFKTLDVVRLEVQGDPVGIPNLLKNPDGERGAWGWVTPLPNTAMTTDAAVGVAQLQFSTTVTQGCYFTSEMLAVTPGQFVGARLNVTFRTTADETVRLRVDFFNSALAYISSGSFGAAGGTGARYATTTQAPAGAVRARLSVEVLSAGGALVAGRLVRFLNARVGQAATAATIDAALFAGLTAVPWINIIGPTREISIDRQSLNVGTMSATVLDATLDPATSATIRPGRGVRVMALTAGTWEPLFVGTITNASVTYDLKQQKANNRAKITLTAADNIKALANSSRPDGVATIGDLRAVLEGCGVPWVIDGSTGQVPAAAIVANNDNASALDQIAITRDSVRGYAWVDRRNVLNAYSPGLMPTTLAATLTDTVYTALDRDYDTARCINTVTVKLLRPNLATGQTVEVTYGPYVDQASVDLWGPFASEFTVQGLPDTETAISAYAAAILTASATPQVRTNSVAFPIRSTTELTAVAGSKRALIDLYDLVTVSTDATPVHDRYPTTDAYPATDAYPS